ncbi:MAG: PepSY domain-containing protein [Gammaproteobacteria bacterium]
MKMSTACVIASLTCLLPLMAARAYSGQQYAHAARISLAQARAIALKAFPGRIVKEELEKEAGGSGLRYSFDIRSHRVVHEVGVDAKTGKLLENSDDSQAKD